MFKNTFAIERHKPARSKSMQLVAFSFLVLYETISNATLHFDMRKARLMYSSDKLILFDRRYTKPTKYFK